MLFKYTFVDLLVSLPVPALAIDSFNHFLLSSSMNGCMVAERSHTCLLVKTLRI